MAGAPLAGVRGDQALARRRAEQARERVEGVAHALARERLAAAVFLPFQPVNKPLHVARLNGRQFDARAEVAEGVLLDQPPILVSCLRDDFKDLGISLQPCLRVLMEGGLASAMYQPERIFSRDPPSAR